MRGFSQFVSAMMGSSKAGSSIFGQLTGNRAMEKPAKQHLTWIHRCSSVADQGGTYYYELEPGS